MVPKIILLTKITKKRMILQILIIFALRAHTKPNFVQNPHFQTPQISPHDSIPFSQIPSWKGQFNLEGQAFSGLQRYSVHQVLDLCDMDSGYAEQQLQLPCSGSYSFSFDSYVIQGFQSMVKTIVQWNNQTVLIHTSQNTQKSNIQVSLDGKHGPNTLRLTAAANHLSGYGLHIDDLKIELQVCYSVTNITQVIISIIGNVGSLPMRLFKVRSFFLLIDDLCMYSYSNREYDGIIRVVLDTSQKIEDMKWSFFNYVTRLNLRDIQFSISDYSKFSNPKHQKVEEKDDSALKNLYPFLFFSFPQAIFLIYLLRWIFYRLFFYQVSSFIRKFCFIPCCILEISFQGNIAYFTYVCMNNFKNCFFAFKFNDKLSLILNTLFLFVCLIYIFCFYFIMNKFFVKKFTYFIEYTYRNFCGMLYLTVCFPLRAFLRGLVFSFYYESYFEQIFYLSLIELLIIFFIVFLQSKYQIFIKKTIYVLLLLFYFQFILFNLSLAIDQYLKKFDDKNNMLWEFSMAVQKNCIFFFFATTFILVIVQFLPKIWFKGHSEETKNEEKKKTKLSRQIKLSAYVKEGIENRWMGQKKRDDLFLFRGEKEKKKEKTNKGRMMMIQEIDSEINRQEVVKGQIMEFQDKQYFLHQKGRNMDSFFQKIIQQYLKIDSHHK